MDEFPGLSLFFKAFQASYSELPCISPCFCPYEYIVMVAETISPKSIEGKIVQDAYDEWNEQ